MNQLELVRTTYRVSDFISWQKHGTLELSPSFQRRSVWRPIEKSLLVDTVVRGFPMPVIFLRHVTSGVNQIEPMRQVVDGQQRIRTLLSFVSPEILSDWSEKDRFTVRPTHNEDIAGLSFEELREDYRRRILDYEFSTHVFGSDTDDREILKIFARMNSTGVKLSAQELRNAEFIGEFKTSMYELGAEQLPRWREWDVFSEQEIARMEEVELTSELALLMLSGKISGKTKSALDRVYDVNEDSFPQKAEISKRFRTVMDSVDEKLGRSMSETAFNRKTLMYPLLAAIYELQYGIGSTLENAKAKPFSKANASWIREAGMLIAEQSAPTELQEEIRSHTTHPRTRTMLVDYLVRR